MKTDSWPLTTPEPAEDAHECWPHEIRIGILAKDRPIQLRACLDSLALACEAAQVASSVTVFDDASSDPEAVEIIRSVATFSPNWSAVRRELSGGDWASAHNWAMSELCKQAPSRTLIGTMDSDVLSSREWIDGFSRWAVTVREKALGSPAYFSAFNSSDLWSHSPVSRFERYGIRYLVKRQMGGAHLFIFSDDVSLVGSFPRSIKLRKTVLPRLDDESRMTRRMKRRGVKNVCTSESWVEHLGADSVLNAVRHVPVRWPVYGLHQRSTSLVGDGFARRTDTPGLLQAIPPDVTDSRSHRCDVALIVRPEQVASAEVVADALLRNLAQELGECVLVCEQADAECLRQGLADQWTIVPALNQRLFPGRGAPALEATVLDYFSNSEHPLVVCWGDCVLTREHAFVGRESCVQYVREYLHNEAGCRPIASSSSGPEWWSFDVPIQLWSESVRLRLVAWVNSNLSKPLSGPSDLREAAGQLSTNEPMSSAQLAYSYQRSASLEDYQSSSSRLYDGDPTRIILLAPRRQAKLHQVPPWSVT
jgi:hypothetical protein